jgi:threonine/homoserine/homoserine lactone efflux protein
MNWTLWWVFVPANAIVCLVPGPAVLLILSTALRLGWRKSVASNMGIIVANAVYYAISMTSLGALLVASYRFFSWIKWLGVAYLLFLGLREIFSRQSILAPAQTGEERTWAALLRQGVLTQFSNPKAILFFAAFLPQFVDPAHKLAPQVVVLGITGEVVEFFILLGYGVFAGAAGRLARQQRYVAWINRTAGVLLILAAVGLGFLK